MENQVEPFAIKDCALISIATGKRAQDVRMLRAVLERVSLDCIYYHFWTMGLRSGFEDPEYHNDFATWAFRRLQDKVLAERLALLDPTEHKTLEDLRQELLEVLDERIDETECPRWTAREEQFEFLRSQIVIFDTHHVMTDPRQLAGLVPKMSPGSIFYHFIDARRRNESGLDDFRNWLESLGGYEELEARIAAIDPYFSTLIDVRRQLGETFAEYFMENLP